MSASVLLKGMMPNFSGGYFGALTPAALSPEPSSSVVTQVRRVSVAMVFSTVSNAAIEFAAGLSMTGQAGGPGQPSFYTGACRGSDVAGWW